MTHVLEIHANPKYYKHDLSKTCLEISPKSEKKHIYAPKMFSGTLVMNDTQSFQNH